MSDQRIQEIEDRTGSEARSLRGHLADTGNPDVGACPNEISETVAEYYALTECGRLFHWRYDRLREKAVSRMKGGLYFRIYVDGEKWTILRRTLLNRVFSDRVLNGEPDWSEYDHNRPIPGVEKDPLREKEKPADSWVVTNDNINRDRAEYARRFFYGT